MPSSVLRLSIAAVVSACFMVGPSPISAQEGSGSSAPPAASAAATTSSGATPALQGTVPRLVRFSGVVNPQMGQMTQHGQNESTAESSSPSVVGLTLALYQEQEGGTPLWVESQNVQLDGQGRYTVLLGATQADGLPLDLFTSGQARWLGVTPQLPGAGEQPRVLLVGMPYALKAADADTLGGKPASAFVLADGQSPAGSGPSAGGGASNTGSPSPNGRGESQAPSGYAQSANKTAVATPSVAGSGTANFVPLWTSGTNLGNSLLFQTTGGEVAIGTTAPVGKFEVQSPSLVSVRGLTSSTTSNSVGVEGRSTTTSGVNFGVAGVAASPQGYGIGGINLASTGAAVGVRGLSSSTSGIGVLGAATPNSGAVVGVEGEVFSANGIAGVFNNTAGGEILSGQNNGQELFSVAASGTVTVNSSSGDGGDFTGAGYITNQSGGNGVTGNGGYSGGNGGAGVIGNGGGESTTGGPGVIGNGGDGTPYSGPGGSFTGGTAIGCLSCVGGDGLDAMGADGGPGILAQGSYNQSAAAPAVVAMGADEPPLSDGIDATSGGAGAFAGSFTGDVNVSGNLTVSGTKHFRIDHPLDPANKYLYHAALESSEVLNLYSGNAVLDANGEAAVQLPDWLESLNRDFRYQLTAIGAPAPNLHIAQEIQNHSFRIAGGPAGMKVSWQVTGVRQDAWEKAHPMVVEVEKPQRERGYYIHPELYGAGKEKQIDWARYPALMKHIKEMQKKARRQAELAKQTHNPADSSVSGRFRDH
jgi:trimeric autotransporter adhesin